MHTSDNIYHMIASSQTDIPEKRIQIAKEFLEWNSMQRMSSAKPQKERKKKKKKKEKEYPSTIMQSN